MPKPQSYRLLRQEHAVYRWTPRAMLGADPQTFNAGLPKAPPEDCSLVLDLEGEEPCDFLEWPCPVVSPAMRHTLDAAGVDNIDYFPLRIEREGGDERYEGYLLANVIGRVACVDWDSSHSAPGEALRAFHIDPAAARDLLLFRLAEQPSLLIVHPHVAERLQRARLHGLALQATQDYDGGFVELPDPDPDPEGSS